MSAEHFIVKFYTADEGPTIKGNGFDGTRVGDDRQDAEELTTWVNARLDRIAALEILLGDIRKYMVPGNVMPVPEQAKHIVKWIDSALSDAGVKDA